MMSTPPEVCPRTVDVRRGRTIGGEPLYRADFGFALDRVFLRLCYAGNIAREGELAGARALRSVILR